ncbi:hypothetical protein Bca101_019946 [Brassica carinata]
MVVRHPTAPFLIGFVVLQENKDSKKRRDLNKKNSDGASSEYDNFSSYSESPIHMLWLNYTYVTAELCIRYS